MLFLPPNYSSLRAHSTIDFPGSKVHPPPPSLNPLRPKAGFTCIPLWSHAAYMCFPLFRADMISTSCTSIPARSRCISSGVSLLKWWSYQWVHAAPEGGSHTVPGLNMWKHVASDCWMSNTHASVTMNSLYRWRLGGLCDGQTSQPRLLALLPL